MFKSEDEKRAEAAAQAGKTCPDCNGTGTYGRGNLITSDCSKCGGTGQR